MPRPTRRPATARRRTSRRGKRGKPGPVGPKGDPGAWPAAAYDALNEQMQKLRADLDDMRATVASLQEQVAATRFGAVQRRPLLRQEQSES